MNSPRVTDRDDIDFLIGTPREASACEAPFVQPLDPKAPAPGAFRRLLSRLEPDPEALGHEGRPHVRCRDHVLIIDDTVLDKPYTHQVGLVGPFGSGKHQRVLPVSTSQHPVPGGPDAPAVPVRADTVAVGPTVEAVGHQVEVRAHRLQRDPKGFEEASRLRVPTCSVSWPVAESTPAVPPM